MVNPHASALKVSHRLPPPSSRGWIHYDPQVIRHHSPRDRAIHPRHAVVAEGIEAIAALEDTDPPLTARAEALLAAKPTLPLFGALGGRRSP
jgi:hypothetical protein